MRELIRNPKHIFQPISFRLSTGTSYLDGRRYVLLSEPVALQLRSLLTKLLNHKYILTEPKAHSHTYYDLEFVVFESKKTYFKTTDKLKNLNKVIKKQERLNSFQCQWGRASHLVSERAHVFLSVDVEAYEHNHSCLLEIGWTLFDSRRQLLQDQHYLISDYRNLSNGTYVADRKRNFMFGTSVWSTLKEALRELNRDLEWAVRRDGGIILVGHDLKSDIDYLNKAGIAWPWAESSSEDFMQQFDTAEIYAAKTGNPNNKTGLGKSLDDLGIDNWCLHNAGEFILLYFTDEA